MKRFFAFGCSYTFYSWPTWADFLGLSAEEYENWAIPGLGNQAIFERVVEANTRKKFSKDDVIIIQWSSHLRYDWFNRHSLKDRTSNWRTNGSIFSIQNKEILDPHWFYHFFDEFGFLYHTLNFISAAQSLLDAIGCQYYMTGMGDIRNLGHDLIDDTDFKENLSEIDKSWHKYPDLLFYEKTIWRDHEHIWLEPQQSYAQKHKEKFFKFADRKRIVTDLHPSPWHHSQWIKEIVQPRLKVNIKTLEINNIVNSVEEIYQKYGKEKPRDVFDNLLTVKNEFFIPQGMEWPKIYKGIW